MALLIREVLACLGNATAGHNFAFPDAASFHGGSNTLPGRSVTVGAVTEYKWWDRQPLCRSSCGRAT